MQERPPAVERRTSGSSVLPCALGSSKEIARRMGHRRPALFLDFDGTLARIVPHPDQARLEPGLQDVLEGLVRRVPVGVISGRSAQDVKKRVPVDPLQIAGDHGLVFLEADGERMAPPVQTTHLLALEQAAKEIQGRLGPIEGAWVESKRCTFAVHTRQVDAEQKPRVVAIVDEVLPGHELLVAQQGREVVDVRPRVEWDKGSAVTEMMRRLEATDDRFVPFVIGDDVTDEPAFRAVRDRGIGVHVGPRGRETAAEYHLAGPPEVKELLARLLAMLTSAEPVLGPGHEPRRGPDL